MKKIIMTGGGTAGHVIPNIALFEELKKNGYEIVYIGSKNGIERKLIHDQGINYYPISSGKLRRYFDFKNFTDFFRVIGGIISATNIIRKEKPNVVFSKGGFVSVPVVIGAYLNRKNIIIHESDLSVGLANRIASKFSKKILTSFEKTAKLFPEGKGVFTGSPIRNELLKGSREKALKLCGLKDDKPFLFLTGGSLGARALNDALIKNLDEITNDFNVIHQCGKGNKDNSIKNPRYVSYEFISSEMKDIFALADLVIARAGSNTIFELLKLAKPHILIPLSKKASRGDQIDNAKIFKDLGFSHVLFEEEMDDRSFLKAIHDCYENKEKYIKNMNSANKSIGNQKIIDEIIALTK